MMHLSNPYYPQMKTGDSYFYLADAQKNISVRINLRNDFISIYRYIELVCVNFQKNISI